MLDQATIEAMFDSTLAAFPTCAWTLTSANGRHCACRLTRDQSGVTSDGQLLAADVQAVATYKTSGMANHPQPNDLVTLSRTGERIRYRVMSNAPGQSGIIRRLMLGDEQAVAA